MAADLLALGVGSCAAWAGVSARTPDRPPASAVATRGASASGSAERLTDGTELGQRYAAHLERHRDLTYPNLKKELGIGVPRNDPLSFDPTRLAFFEDVARELALTPEEKAVFAREGMVSIDHEQRYSMGSAYFAIYARDLPVLITTDSILHALHRSYEELLKQLETGLFTATLRETLRAAHDELGIVAVGLKDPKLLQSAQDLDVYLGVAQNLLAGAGAPGPDAEDLRVPSKLGQASRIRELLGYVGSLRMQAPGQSAQTRLNGGARYVDYSQFRVRGHYTESEELGRYFRALLWLGRADLGFVLDPPDPASGLEIDVERERRNAALLAIVLRDSKQLARLGTMNQILEFLVGHADNVDAATLNAALQTEALTLENLTDATMLQGLRERLATMAPNEQAIRSQVLESPRGRLEEIPKPQIFQPFGQRFTLDAFVLSRVVYDSIRFQGTKPERLVPSGLDVMAALGNDEAIILLEPELTRHDYSANLLAARRAIEEEGPTTWTRSLYASWLDALRTLDDVPRGFFPEVMQRTAWRRKQLQTQLASWAELRHDTVAYAKQSYSAFPSCGYPDAYVEPYPAFYARVAALAEHGAKVLRELDLPPQDPALGEQRERHVRFLTGFAEIVRKLEALAKKELAGEPFSAGERDFLEHTISAAGGSGPPRYDGWYARLIYRPNYEESTYRRDDPRTFTLYTPVENTEPSAWKPTVADVHTSAGNDREPPKVLEAGVGDVEFLLIAVDNDRDRAVYVGPVYSYYEFTEAPENRLTDAAWQERIRTDRLPPRPAWTDLFRAPAAKRALDRMSYWRSERRMEIQRKLEKTHLLLEEIADPTERQAVLTLKADLEHAGRQDPLSARSAPAPIPTDAELDALIEALSKREFDRARTGERLDAALRAAADHCTQYGAPGERARVAVTFAPPFGTATKVEIDAPALARSETGACVERVLRRVRAPRFEGAATRLTRELTLARRR